MNSFANFHAFFTLRAILIPIALTKITLISYGVPPLGGVKQLRGGKTSYFRAKCVNIAKTVGDTSKFTISG